MIHLCSTCGCKDAESFEAEVYAIEDGGKTEMSFQELFDKKRFNNGIDNEYFLTKKERDDYYDKVYAKYDAESFGAETFELIMIDSLGKRETFGEYETYEDAEIDLEESFPREDYEMMDFEIINKSTNPPSRKHKFGAESFEGQSPMMKNITAIGVLALAIIIGKKIKR